ncbi:MAG TPA: bifunctional diaminohydroxyphosphoribosylaminopyrimidine deaminase/5-amino-6-(5-phosphoribosylamino)uracil reductase RibD [Microbacteriaceae bacterium]|nr:bifunctional diaminohydroxyphosphoribosylaminopyrimidine deaminase/5-amino-6-(5-phosphoribosylamino)uracil reductase RibD [Microbacteriaceae bacterium]
MRDDEAMRRALALAANGPSTGVNPRVGCVILSPDGEVVAEGWHRGAGTAHAEVDALSHCAAPAGCTAVVSLEPCNHTGRTGPCSEALIAAGIRRVVYAVPDPTARAAGGARRLAEAGVEVTGGVCLAEAEAFLGDWLVAARLGRPFVTVKWAASLDGRVAADDGSSQWITGGPARRRVHEQRAANDAVIVGTGTILADDASLTARRDDGSLLPDQPIPVVVGMRQIPEGAAVRRHPHPPIFAATHDLRALIGRLMGLGVRTVYVEGGPTLASAFIRQGLADRYRVFVAPTLLGGARTAIGEIGVASLAAARPLEFTSVERLGADLLITAVPAGETGRARTGEGKHSDPSVSEARQARTIAGGDEATGETAARPGNGG